MWLNRKKITLYLFTPYLFAPQESSLTFKLLYLKAITNPENFIQAFPQELLPQESDSFEDNSLMEIVPKALVNKDTGFKNELLTFFLQKNKVAKSDP